jgi:endonuclease/exonuclease/phosphatase family metal-dependent hydrolase
MCSFLKSTPNLWDKVKQKHNTVIMLRLQDQITKKSFVVSTYHMPCAFIDDNLMLTHATLLANAVRYFAKKDKYVIAGDFNSIPGSSSHTLLKTGKLENQTLCNLDESEIVDFEFKTPQLYSAYASVNGAEPMCTNHSKISRTGELFSNTIDYIWGSDDFFSSVEILPNRSELPESLPSVDQPSDHLMIGAEFWI